MPAPSNQASPIPLGHLCEPNAAAISPSLSKASAEPVGWGRASLRERQSHCRRRPLHSPHSSLPPPLSLLGTAHLTATKHVLHASRPPPKPAMLATLQEQN